MKQPITVFVSPIFVSVRALYFFWVRKALLTVRWMGCVAEMTILDNAIEFQSKVAEIAKAFES